MVSFFGPSGHVTFDEKRMAFLGEEYVNKDDVGMIFSTATTPSSMSSSLIGLNRHHVSIVMILGDIVDVQNEMLVKIYIRLQRPDS